MGNRERIIDLDKRHVWHPYTPMAEYIAETNPLVIERAAGSRLYDVDGRSYLDGNASWWTAVLGHNHPRLVAALTRQAETLCHTALGGITHEPAATLAEKLVGVAPRGLTRVFFVDNGSTAVEAALRLSLQYQFQNHEPGRTRLVALANAFHGETLGAVALGGVEEFRRSLEAVLPKVDHLASPADGLDAAIDALRRFFASQGETVAALVLEPMLQGAGGMRTYDAEYLREARRVTRAAGALLVVDEVFTGYGRTGPMWASEHAGVTPDILCTAKGMSGGILPMGAVLVTERVFSGFLGDPSRAFFYGHTFCGNPLGAAVANEVLAVYEDEHVLEAARGKARRIAETFAELGELPHVSAARSLGMLGALELSGGRGYLERAGWRVYTEALRRGAYVRPLGNTVYVTPALNILDGDLAELLQIVCDSVRAVAGARKT
jgi:adenosylmethionine-8-amino-7-oxononanoate aminotransferase